MQLIQGIFAFFKCIGSNTNRLSDSLSFLTYLSSRLFVIWYNCFLNIIVCDSQQVQLEFLLICFNKTFAAFLFMDDFCYHSFFFLN